MNCSHSDHSASNINSSQLGIQHDPARLQNDVAASPPQYESLDLNDRIGLSGLENTRHGRKGSREPQYTISKEHNWKPWRIRSPALIGFIVFSLGLAITLEILAQKGQRYGALARSSSVDDISDLARLAALYLPTVAAVLYGFFFACVDLDLKRIQPWVELAKSEGTTATNSLLLDYAFDFVAFVPFTAARRRHWPVFYAGTVMMIIFWAITPLQSSIFGPGSTTLTHSATISYPEMLIPIRQQAAVMDVSIFNGAFATTWLSQIYPSSTTADSATLPIHAIQSPDGGTNISATGWTWQLTTELNCWPAIEGNLTWDNGQGCSVSRSFAVSMEGTLNMITNRYIGYYDNALVDFSLGSKTCGSNFKHQFFAVNAFNSTTGGTPKDAKINALFCEPTYYKRNITVSISQETLKPDFSMITSQGPKLVLSDDEFNRTAFEYLIGTGVPSVDLPRDITDSENIEPYYQVKRRDERISWPIQAMSGLVIGSRNYTGEELLDSAALIDACSAAQKAMFSVAVAKLLSNGSGTQPGTITYTVHGILVSRPISAVVEILLVVTATLVGLTWLHCRKMQTKLSEDPSTLAKVMKIAQRNSALTAQFSRMDQMNDEDLIKAFEPMQFKTEYDNTITSLSCISENNQPVTSRGGVIQQQGGITQAVPIQPMILRIRIGVLVISLLFAGTTILAYLKYQEIKLGGLPRPSENFEVLQLLENYIPTVFATFLEPVWVLINRVYCLVQPFRSLQKGNSIAKHSIEAKYTSLMPQLNALRSIKSSHYFLSSVCTVALLANVLAVGLSGVFEETVVEMEYDNRYQLQRSLSTTRKTVVKDRGTSLVGYSDNLQVVLSNLSAHTALPPWTSPEAYFLPFTDTTKTALSSDRLKANTTGITIEPRCSVLSANSTSGTYVHSVFNSTHQQMSVYTINEDNSSIQCGIGVFKYNSTVSDSHDDIIPDVYNGAPIGQSSLEIYMRMSSLDDNPKHVDWCQQRLFAGWLHVNATSNGDIQEQPQSMFLQCVPVVRTGSYEVTVDSKGYVVEQRRVGALNDIFLSGTNTSKIVGTELDPLTGAQRNKWQNTTNAGDWMNSFLKLYLNTTSLIDPELQLPDPNAVLPAFETIMQEIVAVLFGLNPDFFNATNDETFVDGFLVRTETRIFMSDWALSVSLAILGINITMVLVVYTRGLGVILPRLPSTIGSILGYVAASRAVKEYTEPDEMTTEGVNQTQTFTFGKFIGQDGEPHVGIELDPYVLPLDIRNKRSPFRKDGPDLPDWV